MTMKWDISREIYRVCFSVILTQMSYRVAQKRDHFVLFVTSLKHPAPIDWYDLHDFWHTLGELFQTDMSTFDVQNTVAPNGE